VRRVALIGGTGTARLVPAHALARQPPATRWGEPSAALATWSVGAAEVLYLPRHGPAGGIAPHAVNYRANIDVLRAAGAQAVIGINTVGGITSRALPGRLLLPVQLIDYTWGRPHSYCDGEPLRHVEFDPPVDERLRRALLAAAVAASVEVVDGGCYGVTQGPRLETAAEIDRLAADGCDIVGMTAMPEAALAREAGLAYAICAVVVNRAAGRLPPGASIHAQVARHLDDGMARVARLLEAFFAA
jgi:5'-methylthioinosine phosphorylase